MDDWVNWSEFAAMNASDPDAAWNRQLEDQRFIDSKLGELDSQAAAYSQGTGQQVNLGDYSAYQDLINRRDDWANEQRQRAAGPAWEQDLAGPAPTSSPWDSLSRTLGTQQQHWNQVARQRASMQRYQQSEKERLATERARRDFAEQQAANARAAEQSRRSRVSDRLSRDNTSGWWNPDGEESYAEYSDRVGKTYETKNRSAWR